jgi:hypothetical protein
MSAKKHIGRKHKTPELKKPELQVEIKHPCLNMAAHKLYPYNTR